MAAINTFPLCIWYTFIHVQDVVAHCLYLQTWILRLIVLYNLYIYIYIEYFEWHYTTICIWPRRILIVAWPTMTLVKSVIFTATIKFFVYCKLKALYCLFLCQPITFHLSHGYSSMIIQEKIEYCCGKFVNFFREMDTPIHFTNYFK